LATGISRKASSQTGQKQTFDNHAGIVDNPNRAAGLIDMHPARSKEHSASPEKGAMEEDGVIRKIKIQGYRSPLLYPD
jgi:hypothetical protein